MRRNVESTSAVFVVEDEELLRALAAWRLEEAGFEVVQAANADEARELMSYRPALDVLFTDVQMVGPLDGALMPALEYCPNPRSRTNFG